MVSPDDPEGRGRKDACISAGRRRSAACLLHEGRTDGTEAIGLHTLILGIAAQGVALLQPRLSGDLIAGVQKNDSIACAAAMLGVLVAAEAILTAVQQAILGRIGEGTVYRVRCRLVDGFLRMRMLDRGKESASMVFPKDLQ